jgi:hypothetical protein
LVVGASGYGGNQKRLKVKPQEVAAKKGERRQIQFFEEK